jgi:hypothetical protein
MTRIVTVHRDIIGSPGHRVTVALQLLRGSHRSCDTTVRFVVARILINIFHTLEYELCSTALLDRETEKLSHLKIGNNI